MGRILTEDLVREALLLAAPSIKAILRGKEKPKTSGARWVAVAVSGPGLAQNVWEVGDVGKWHGDPPAELPSFHGVALAKLEVALATGRPSREVVSGSPWNFKQGQYLYGGSTISDGLAVAASGAYSETDEGIAEMVLAIITMLCRLERRRMLEAGIKQII